MRPDVLLVPGGQRGISLLEYVLGLVILAIVLVGAGLFFLSQPRQLDPVFQFRAVSLAEALAEQIVAVKYDANNNPVAQERCGIDGVPACANSPQASASDEVSSFAVVDDFQLWCNDGEKGAVGAVGGEALAAQLDLPEAQLYRRFTVETCVSVNEDDPDNIFKRVEIKVAIDQGTTLSFTLHRYNIR
ncbi:type IV pilus modification PilV family protein [Oceanisphaera psychrotolerans]|uniref:Prepilin-type cleavage/methylation-like protein n=1 Tax=Oceanisphaera psychrotolerans TaxID=1414654 RepID=A0A1J4QHT4_9GAMM|nr:prepilin-type cleavage/methylation-like protein [Oceanisphaera psychrotolerans]OIN14014.1 prepilin-type cleavage/methylation-like protein [Oceanisphaera psychrotolerans]